MLRSIFVLIGLLFAVALLAPPAQAQFDTIFRDEPPRPPADIPPPPAQQPGYYPQSQQYPQYPERQGQYPDRRAYPPYPDRQAYPDQRPYPDYGRYPPSQRGPIESRDEPPSQPMPAPMNLPPSARPGRGTIESQPLAPLPGTATPKQADRPITPQSPQPAPQPQPGAPAQNASKTPAGGQPSNQPQASPPPPPTDEVVIQPPPQRITNPTAVFEGLDKVTGRITSFDVAINETVQFGALQVTPKACYSRPPTETPQTDAFVAVDEVTLKGKIKRIFTGWMFAASPGLHAVEHPIYDVWLIDCKGGKLPAVADVSGEGHAEDPVPKPRQ
ncbi:MAG TPA: DUF2155 domain-containing protein [Pseudolabrys sp.]|nr:DUF2155 domain-containing protein [Pseudolabrys sp.]